MTSMGSGNSMVYLRGSRWSYPQINELRKITNQISVPEIPFLQHSSKKIIST